MLSELLGGAIVAALAAMAILACIRFNRRLAAHTADIRQLTALLRQVRSAAFGAERDRLMSEAEAVQHSCRQHWDELPRDLQLIFYWGGRIVAGPSTWRMRWGGHRRAFDFPLFRGDSDAA